VPFAALERTVMPERKIEWNQLMEEALTMPGNMQGVYDRFYPYSLANIILLRMQGVREPIATYKRWQSLGRQVLSGAKAKEIIVPLMRKVAVEPDPARSDTPRYQEVVTGFKLVKAVFPLSATTGQELPPPPTRTWRKEQALQNLGVTEVPFDELDGNVQGYARGYNLAINPVAVHPEKTLMHELGHIVLGHTLPWHLSEYATHRGIMEFQAEGTAYLCLNELEQLDDTTATHSRGYIRHWLQNEQPPERAIRQVFGAADRILKAGRLAVASTTQITDESSD
jgi:hypothetical protein